MKVILIRHGLTKLNEEKRYQGQVDEPLSEFGRSQLKPAGESPAVVYVSPLLRARETAELLFPKARQVVVPGFTEIDFGEFDTKKADDMWKEDERYRKWVDSGCTTTPPGGEAIDAFVGRNRKAFLEIVKEAEDPLVIVAHGGTQRAILHSLGKEKDASYFDWFLEPANGYVMEWDGTGLSVLSTHDYRTGGQRE